MLSMLTRILLALVTAFVFTGQMEAAAQHCARLAEAAAAAEAAPVAEAETPPCHETGEAAAMAHDTQPHHPAPHADHSSAPDTCECIAALKVCVGVAGAGTSTLAEPYAWLAESEARIASSEPDPDLRPPRA